jgi:hypothetical protein
MNIKITKDARYHSTRIARADRHDHRTQPPTGEYQFGKFAAVFTEYGNSIPLPDTDLA